MRAATPTLAVDLRSAALDLVRRAKVIEPGNRGVYIPVEGNTGFAIGDLDGAVAAFESGLLFGPFW